MVYIFIVFNVVMHIYNNKLIYYMTTTNESLTETKRKTITLDEETYKRLGKVGTFGESFDNLINRILDEREGKKSK